MRIDLWGKTPADYAIACLQAYEPPEGYFLAFSGGLDSVCLHDLAERSGVKFDGHYSATGIEPPQLTRFIRDHYPAVVWERPKQSFWAGVWQNGLPTRRQRWCCRSLKECHGNGRVVLVGVRKAESNARAARWRQISVSTQHGMDKRFVAPILDWSDDDRWDYIRERGLPYCELYDQGWTRVGCIPCPFSGLAHLDEFPGLERACRNAARRYIELRQTDPRRKPPKFSGDEYYEWWRRMAKGNASDDKCQLELMYT